MMATAKRPKLRRLHRRNYRGVFWDRETGWFAQQSDHDGAFWHDDSPQSEGEAALLYDAHIRELYGADGLYNFPRAGEKSVFCEADCEMCGPGEEAA